MRTKNGRRRVVLGVGLLLGCASARGTQSVAPTPVDIPALEARRQQSPSDPALLTRLGIAYYDSKDFPLARDVLLAALALDEERFPAALYLGLTYEQMGHLDSARTAYAGAANAARSSAQRNEARARLQLLTRTELAEAAREAIAREAELSAETPAPNTIAVLPFRYLGNEQALRPLERGMAFLIVSDLSKVGRLRLLEREHVQALVDELELSESGRVDQSTGARSGRLLRAAQVVQGSLQDVPNRGHLRVDANIVNASDAAVAASGWAADKLQQLFAIEKEVVLQLLQRVGIGLTPAEERAIKERPTADLQAFLAFSRGLEAEDRGDYTTAAEEFGAAAQRDRGFRSARERQAVNQRLASQTRLGLDDVAALGDERGDPALIPSQLDRDATLRTAMGGAVPSSGAAIIRRIGTVPPALRPGIFEALRRDDPRVAGLFGTLIIIVDRP